MQNSSQLKSTFNFFTDLLYCYKCILLYLSSIVSGSQTGVFYSLQMNPQDLLSSVLGASSTIKNPPFEIHSLYYLLF